MIPKRNAIKIVMILIITFFKLVLYFFNNLPSIGSAPKASQQR